MEQHPVPQNVTTFQFRLIGDMTIKQFGYLASGIILGYIFYKLPLPFFFTWPLAIGSGVLGFGLAFVPVEERPMDIWIASFFKNVYSPTQYVWQKKPPIPTITTPVGTPKPEGRAELPATQTMPPPHGKQHPMGGYELIVKQLVGLFSSLFKPTNTHQAAKSAVKTATVVAPPQHLVPVAPTKPAQSPTPQVVLSLDRVSDPFAWIKRLFHTTPKVGLSPGLEFNNALASDKHTAANTAIPIQQHPLSPPLPVAQPAPPVGGPSPIVQHPPTAGHRVVELQDQLSESLAQRERLEKELVELHQKMEQQTRVSGASQQPMRHATMTPTTNTQTSVRVFTPEAATKAGLPRLTTFPNIVTGIIKDYNGNLLPGILITVRDTTDTPLRALKTNKLGQFAASTPLPNGTYIVEIEDPKNALVFDKVQIPLSGTVAPPIEVVSKSQKRVERDKLAREIFGNQQM